MSVNQHPGNIPFVRQNFQAWSFCSTAQSSTTSTPIHRNIFTMLAVPLNAVCNRTGRRCVPLGPKSANNRIFNVSGQCLATSGPVAPMSELPLATFPEGMSVSEVCARPLPLGSGNSATRLAFAGLGSGNSSSSEENMPSEANGRAARKRCTPCDAVDSMGKCYWYVCPKTSI